MATSVLITGIATTAIQNMTTKTRFASKALPNSLAWLMESIIRVA